MHHEKAQSHFTLTRLLRPDINSKYEGQNEQKGHRCDPCNSCHHLLYIDSWHRLLWLVAQEPTMMNSDNLANHGKALFSCSLVEGCRNLSDLRLKLKASAF